MDIVAELKDAYAFLGDPLHRKAYEEIERLRNEFQFTDEVRQSALQSLAAVEEEYDRLWDETRELHRDISMFMKDGPLKQDLLKTIEDLIGEEE